MVKENINVFKGFLDWLLGKKETDQRIVLLLIIIGVLSWFLYSTQKGFKDELESLNKKVTEQGAIINELQLENIALKYQGILLLDAYKDDPNPRWITDAKTHEVKSVNDAYEKKHLIPLGYNKYDLIGTTGEHIFGKALVDQFIENNKLVVKLGRAITFEKEVNKTIKFPIGRSNYIYAIGGYEYLEHR